MALRKITNDVLAQCPDQQTCDCVSPGLKRIVPGSKAPFFIFGCCRSGTSLLSRMLNQHANIAVPYESHLFNTFHKLLHYYGDLSRQCNVARLVDDMLTSDVMRDWDPALTRNEILGNLKRNNFCGVVDAVLSTYAIKTGKARWGEKTPHHIYYWDYISHHFPNAKIVHIVRDGRDVALSLMDARFGPKSVYSCAQYWQHYLAEIEEVKKKAPPGTIHETSYEKLLKNPGTELAMICDFLGEEFLSEMLDFHKNTSAYKTDTQNQKNLMMPLLKGNIGKWHHQMSPKSASIFEAIASDTLKNYGYTLSRKPIQKINPSRLFYYRFIETPSKKFIAMARNRKGHRDGLIKLGICCRLKFIDQLRYR